MTNTNRTYGPVKASEVPPMNVTWLWKNYIPRRNVTIIGGDGGSGKSLIAVDLAARVTRAGVQPGPIGIPTIKYAKPRNVLYLVTEDNKSVIQKRLEAANADLDRVEIWDGQISEDNFFSLPHDAKELSRHVKRLNAGLVILDPLSQFLDEKISPNSPRIRRALVPLSNIAEENNCAILGIHHLNKNKSPNLPAIDRLQGSTQFAAFARSVLIVGADPTGSDSTLLAPAKKNLAPDVETVQYHVESPNGTPRVVWDRYSDVPVDRITSRTSTQSPGVKAERFLLEFLATGPKTGNQVKKEGNTRGIAERTLERASKNLPVVKMKQHGNDGRVTGSIWSIVP